jgi:hypothetical protein
MNQKRNLSLLIKNQFAQINPKPIIVLGNQKSGTTAIASLISLASGKSIEYDIFFRAHLTDFKFIKNIILKKLGFNFDVSKYNYLDLLHNGSISLNQFVEMKKSYFVTDVIKDPDFSFFYNELLDIFPKAKFIFIVRNPFDNIRSILNRLDLEGNLSHCDEKFQAKFQFIKTTNPLWGKILDGQNPNVEGCNYIENLALRWNLTVDNYLRNSTNILLVRYENFLEDKVTYINNLCEILGLDVIKKVSPLVDKQYQPKGKHNTTAGEFFGETNYEIIRNLCKDKMVNMGYKYDLY